MKSNSHSLRGALFVLILGTCSVIPGLGCEDKDAGQSPPTRSESGGAFSNRSVAPPVITVDLVQIATSLGASYQIQADSLNTMASGKTLNAQQSADYFEAQKNMANISKQILDMLKKNPRWQRSMTEALESHTKKGIIASTQADIALQLARKARSAGSLTGKCPADIQKILVDNELIVRGVRGFMPYSNSEMTTPITKSDSLKSDSK